MSKTIASTFQNPTTLGYNYLATAYDYYNEHLFDGKLPACMITLTRRGGTMGYYCHNRFKKLGDDDLCWDEIALNPVEFRADDVREAMQTLVHEMCHLWQEHYGKPSQGYHNHEWAKKMIDVGLMPTDTGKPGGRIVGRKMGDYVVEGGRFEAITTIFFKQYLPELYADVHKPRPRRGGSAAGGRDPAQAKLESKTKFTCPKCKANAWGKLSLNIMCGDCKQTMAAGEQA